MSIRPPWADTPSIDGAGEQAILMDSMDEVDIEAQVEAAKLLVASI